MLKDVHEIDQKTYMDLVRIVSVAGGNVMVLGPSGGGKTVMAQQVAEEEGVNLIYVNLGVLERPDFQGFPVLSTDKRFVSYATPDFLPFADVSLSEKRESLEKALEHFKDNDAVSSVIRKELKAAEESQKAYDVRKAMQYLRGKDQKVEDLLNSVIERELTASKSDHPIVFLFDEVDKASTDTTHTLLELLQFGSINGRKLNMRGAVLTGNLPDEHAHSQQISHAITKRCKTYKLNIDFKQWRNWALDAGLNEMVVGFLISNNDWLYKKAPDGDPTAYALPSPRTWEMSSQQLNVLDKHPRYKSLGGSKALEELQKVIVAGCVGSTAATNFVNWLKYFRKIDPYVKELLEHGKSPPSDISAQERIVCAISACSKCFAELKPNNKATIEQYHKNAYKWLGTLTSDLQIAAVRLSIGNNFDKCMKFGLAEIPEFRDVFKNVKTMLGQAGADVATKARK